MKNFVQSLFALVLCAVTSGALMAGGSGSSSKPLAGAYPIALTHGILGFDDSVGLAGGLVKYWGDLDAYLRSQGATVLTPGMTAMNNNEFRSTQLKDQLNYWMAANGYTKIHLIAHSQGGMTSRYMITNRGMAGKIASLTTVNSVHRGTPVADIGLAVIPNWLKPSVATVINVFGTLLYSDNQQDILQMAISHTTTAMAQFNSYTPNVSSVKYFSYGSKMTLADPIQHPIFFLLYPIAWTGGVFNGQGGDNDGIVPLSSQKWGTFKGSPSYPLLTTGIDHLQATNWAWTGQTWYDVQGYYLTMALNAKNNQ